MILALSTEFSEIFDKAAFMLSLSFKLAKLIDVKCVLWYLCSLKDLNDIVKVCFRGYDWRDLVSIYLLLCLGETEKLDESIAKRWASEAAIYHNYVLRTTFEG